MSDGKKSTRPNIQDKIIRLLHEQGPMKTKDLNRSIPFRYKSIYAEALELKAMGLVDKDENGMWSLQPGVTPAALGIEHSVPSASDEELSTNGAESASDATLAGETSDSSAAVVPDQRTQFIQTLQGIGASPKEAVPTIADIFFAGDINCVAWLDKVLRDEAAGYVTPPQRTLMVAYWATTRGLRNEYELLNEEQVSGGIRSNDFGADKKSELVSRPLDLGMGWRVGKNKRGHWVPLPGGPATYEEAADWAAQRELLSGYKRRPRED